MRHNNATTVGRRHAVTALLIAAVVLISGAGWTFDEHLPEHHGPHALPSSISTDFAAIVEHPHAQDGSAPIAPAAFAEAPLPRTVTLLAAIGIVGILGAAISRRATASPGFSRGPPRRCTHLCAGQQLLLRLCIARR